MAGASFLSAEKVSHAWIPARMSSRLTHAHDDHARGLPAIIENFHPSELWTGVTPASEVWSEVQEQARTEKVRIVAMCSGRSFDFGGTHIEILSPPPDYVPGDAPKNNDSLVMRIT